MWENFGGENFGESMLLKLLAWKNLANLLSVDLKILHVSRLAASAFHPHGSIFIRHWPMAYFCAGVTEIYGPRGLRSFSNAWHTTTLVTSMEEDGTTLLKSPLGSGRPFSFTSSSLSSWRCFGLKYFSSPTIVIILFRYSVRRFKNIGRENFGEWPAIRQNFPTPKFSLVRYLVYFDCTHYQVWETWR